MKHFALLFGFAVLAVTGLAQAQTLTHSYDFSDLTEGTYNTETLVTNQATGAQDATLKFAGSGTATVDANSALTLNGTSNANGAYIQLPNDVIGTKTQITLETWTTPINAQLNYSRVFDLGSSSDVATRFFLAFSENTSGNSYAAYQTSGSASIQTGPKYALTSGEEYMLTVTVANNNVINYYVNGVMVARNKAEAFNLSTRVGDENLLGKSHWNDSYANARFDVFNVYDGAVGPTEVRAKYLAGSSASTTESLDTVNAKKIDALIGSAAGYWDGTMNGFTDVSCNSRDLTNHNLVFETTNSAAIGSALSSNGITFRDGKDGINGYATSTEANLFDFTDSATYSTRVKLDTFRTSNGTTAMFMEANAGRGAATFGLATTHGTDSTGVLTLIARGAGGIETQYYLQKNEEAYSLVTEYNVANEYFLMNIDKWYDISGTFESKEDGTGALSLYAYDPTNGSLLAFGSADTAFNTLSQDANELLLMETWGNVSGTVFGVMDYAGVWRYALSPEQIAALSGQYIPEPSTWALLILSAAGLMFFRRKK